MTRLLTPDWTRRATLGGLAAGVGAGVAGFGWQTGAAEPPPETRRIRILQDPNLPVLCWAPQYLAIEFFRMEGFEEIETVPFELPNNAWMLANDRVDLTLPLATDLAIAVDKGAPITLLGGLHVGCVEVFASDRVGGLTDLKGARLLASSEDSDARQFLSVVLTYVGLDPESDVEWVYDHDWGKWPGMLERGEVDVLRAFPSMTYDIQKLGIAKVILNTTVDDPWRNFYCCMIAARSDFVQKYPVATKRALRAFAKAQELCTADREGSAQRLVELGATDRLDYARRALDEIPFGAWRDYDPAATLRFFALRLREAGLIEASPNAIIGRGTDFSFLDELRTEMKL